MNHQSSFSELEYSGNKRQTRRDQFLNQMEQHWDRKEKTSYYS